MPTKAELVEQLLDTFGLTCPLCRKRQATNLHHVICRARTSKKHPAWWLQDERNLLLVCVECDSPMLHTKAGIARCIAIQRERYPLLDFTCEPWGGYL